MDTKWAPPLHPRDRRGRFTSSGVSETKSSNKQFLAQFSAKKKMAPVKTGGDADSYTQTHAATDLTPAQGDAVKTYLTDGATAAKVNASLRAKTPNPEMAATTKDLEGALRPLPDDLVLNRTVSAKAFGPSLEDLPGMTVHDSAFTSTSLGVSYGGPDKVQVKIAAPKGTPAIITGDLSGHPEDREVLLGPGQELAITSVTPANDGGHTMTAVALPSTNTGSGDGGTASSELDQLKAESDKLGPHSKAGVAYRAALAKHDATQTELAGLKVEADKLGPNSKAGLAYKAALAKHGVSEQAEPATPPAPAAKKTTLADLAASLPASKQQATPEPAVQAAPKVTAKPVKVKPAALTAEHKSGSLEGLSPAELAALKLYTGDDYRGINGGLRTGKLAAKYTPAVASIDSALASKPLAQPTKVYRTVSGDAFGLSHNGDPSVLKGKTFTEPGFMSTATSNQRFPVKPPPVHLTFEVPAGVGASYLESITKNQSENELLLPRNLNYVITNVRSNSKNGGWTATARIIPPTVG